MLSYSYLAQHICNISFHKVIDTLYIKNEQLYRIVMSMTYYNFSIFFSKNTQLHTYVLMINYIFKNLFLMQILCIKIRRFCISTKI